MHWGGRGGEPRRPSPGVEQRSLPLPPSIPPRILGMTDVPAPRKRPRPVEVRCFEAAAWTATTRVARGRHAMPTPPASAACMRQAAQCPICMERMGSTGKHCIVSLKCGHLFGHHCIALWLKVRRGHGSSPRAHCSSHDPLCAGKQDLPPVQGVGAGARRPPALHEPGAGGGHDSAGGGAAAAPRGASDAAAGEPAPPPRPKWWRGSAALAADASGRGRSSRPRSREPLSKSRRTGASSGRRAARWGRPDGGRRVHIGHRQPQLCRRRFTQGRSPRPRPPA